MAAQLLLREEVGRGYPGSPCQHRCQTRLWLAGSSCYLRYGGPPTTMVADIGEKPTSCGKAKQELCLVAAAGFPVSVAGCEASHHARPGPPGDDRHRDLAFGFAAGACATGLDAILVRNLGFRLGGWAQVGPPYLASRHPRGRRAKLQWVWVGPPYLATRHPRGRRAKSQRAWVGPPCLASPRSRGC